MSQHGKTYMKRRSAKHKVKVGKAGKASDRELVIAPVVSISGVWTGSIARLRVYVSTGTVFAYKAPGDNADAVGITDDPNVIRALFLARDNGRSITGYTDDIGKIGWLDY